MIPGRWQSYVAGAAHWSFWPWLAAAPWLALLLYLAIPFGDEPLRPQAPLKIYSAEGELLREFRDAQSGAFQEWRTLQEFPPFLVKAVLAAEDQRFYLHPGVDPIALLRAAGQNLAAGRLLSGASTVTQQTARLAPGVNLPRAVWLRKPMEAILALKLELHHRKNTILVAYLNLAPLSRNRRGLSAGAREIFGRDVSFLSRAEMVTLAALLRRNRTEVASLLRRTRQLNERIAAGIPESELAAAAAIAIKRAAPLSSAQTVQLKRSAPHFAAWLSESHPWLRGEVRTAIRARWNESIRRSLHREFVALPDGANLNGAVVVLEKVSSDRSTLALRALVGSRDFDAPHDGQVNGALANRVAGSTLKPFVYALAMDRLDLKPYSILYDSELSLSAATPGESYRPRNYDLRYWGALPMREALAASRNIPAVEIGRRLGEAELYASFERAGFTLPPQAPDDLGPGMALGTSGANLLQLCRAYGAFLHGGELPRLLLGDELHYGEVQRLFSERAALRINRILSDRDERRRSFGPRSFLDFPFPVAAKTGTSKDYFDSWAIVYTPRHVVGVWVGRFAGGPMAGVSGASGAARIAQQTLRFVVRESGGYSAEFAIPRDWRSVAICRRSGQRAGPQCPAFEEWIPPGEALPTRCAEHGAIVGAPTKPDETGRQNRGDRIVSPLPEETFLLDPHTPTGAQAAPIQVSISGAEREYSIQINDQPPRAIGGRRLFPAALPRGRHRVALLRDQKVVDSVDFEVR